MDKKVSVKNVTHDNDSTNIKIGKKEVYELYKLSKDKNYKD